MAHIVNTGKGRLLEPAGNHHADIVAMADGSWRLFAVQEQDASLSPAWERKGSGSKLVMRVRHGDALELDCGDARAVRIVKRITGRYLYLAAPHDAGSLQKRHADAGDRFRWDMASAAHLRARQVVHLRVTALGDMFRRPSNIDTGFATGEA